MLKLKLLVGVAAAAAVVLPAQASAGGFDGIVVGKQPQRGTLFLVGRGGNGLTVRTSAHARLGDRVSLQGVRLKDGTLRVSSLHTLAHVDRTMIRGVVVRQLSSGMLVSAGRSMLMIHLGNVRKPASANDHGGATGDLMQFRVKIEDDQLVEQAPPVQVGQAATAQIEGAIVSVSPLVVSVNGSPITVTVPAGTTLPATLAPGQRIELTVQIGAGNTFTLASIDQVENGNGTGNGNNQPGDQQVEVKGTVMSSTATQIVVSSGGGTFTFVAPTGGTLPILPAGTAVEVRGVQQGTTLTVTRIKAATQNEGDSGTSGASGANGASGTSGNSSSGDGGHDGGGDGGGGGSDG